MAKVEEATPFFALGLLRNLLALVFLAAFVMLFSSAMTAAIGAFFSDLDLDTYHAAPISKTRIVVARWAKTFAQSATMVYIFIAPMFVAFAQRYHTPARLYPIALVNLALLLAIPVTLGALVIIVLVRFFPIQRVQPDRGHDRHPRADRRRRRLSHEPAGAALRRASTPTT